MKQQKTAATAAAATATLSKKRFDAAEEIPIFDWRDLEADVESVLASCNDDGDGWAWATATSVSGTCRFQNGSS